MKSSKPGPVSQAEAQQIAAALRLSGTDNIADCRLLLSDLQGLPMPREASKALVAAIYHLDGVDAACRALCDALGA